MWKRGFWLDTAERALKTVVQSVLALISADGIFSIVDVDAPAVAGAAALAGLISVLTSVGSAKVGTEGTASLVVDEPRPRV